MLLELLSPFGYLEERLTAAHGILQTRQRQPEAPAALDPNPNQAEDRPTQPIAQETPAMKVYEANAQSLNAEGVTDI
jgi:hypothetical protein